MSGIFHKTVPVHQLLTLYVSAKIDKKSKYKNKNKIKSQAVHCLKKKQMAHPHLHISEESRKCVILPGI